MTEQQLPQRIILNPKVMVGKPVIKGTRLTVEYILGLLAHGTTITEILEEYEGLTQEDIQACYDVKKEKDKLQDRLEKEVVVYAAA